MTLEVNEELFVDTTRNHKLQINLDITMPRISCDYLSLDAMALDGEQHLHIEHNIFKRRLDLDGQVIVDATPEKHDVQLSSTDKKPVNGTGDEAVVTTEKPVCASCYGANRTCCNTCQVRGPRDHPEVDINGIICIFLTGRDRRVSRHGLECRHGQHRAVQGPEGQK